MAARIDEGEGQDEDPTLVITWSPVWGCMSTILNKFVIAVLPHRRIVKGVTAPALFNLLVAEQLCKVS